MSEVVELKDFETLNVQEGDILFIRPRVMWNDEALINLQNAAKNLGDKLKITIIVVVSELDIFCMRKTDGT